MRYISDIDGLSVEWESDLGGRYWQSFANEADMQKAIDEQQTELIEEEVMEEYTQHKSL